MTHIKPNNRGTWELNGEVGWYVGPSMRHYRCVKCYFPRTKTDRDCDKVTFFPTSVPFPQVKLVDFLKHAATDIITILTSPLSTATPSLQAGDPVRKALLTLATQLNRIDKLPALQKPTAASPRVLTPTIQRFSEPVACPPRVQESTPSSIPAANLQHHSKTLKNTRFKNTIPHKYHLRPRTRLQNSVGTNFKNIAVEQLTAQHIFQHKAQYIFKSNGKKETIDTLLAGTDKDV